MSVNKMVGIKLPSPQKDLKLSDRVYRCECGNMIDRDFQASINLKTYGEQFAG